MGRGIEREREREREMWIYPVNYSTNGKSSVSHKHCSVLGIDRAFWCARHPSLLLCTAFEERIHIGVTASLRSAIHLCFSSPACCSRCVPCTNMQFLTFWRRDFFFNFSTPCILNVNNTGTKQISIMKQTAFWREKSGEYRACLKYSVPIFVE